MASTYLERTVTTPDTNGNKIATFSAWLKRGSLTEQVFYTSRSSDSNYFRFRFTSDQINVISKTSGTNYFATTSAVFRDTSSWYQVVVTFDTTQATEANRIRIYVNGVEQTKGASSYPSQDSTLYMLASGQPQRIGKESSDGFYDGLMTQVIYTEGYAYAASTFGSTNSVSGEWIPNANPTVTYGTNGFKLTFEDTAALGDDTSGNTNDFTVSGSGTPTLDCASNNFATLNPLDVSRLANTGNTFSNGNLTVTDGSSNYLVAQSTLAATTGKFYWEVKINATTSTSVSGVGVCDFDNFLRNDGAANTAYGWIYAPDGDKRHNGTATAYGDTYAANDIIGIALDMTNGFLYFSKNGTWQNSGNPESGASGTNAAYGSVSGTIGSHAYDGSSTQTHEYSFNFGNGYFGTTAVSSAGTGASTPGTFEYDVPNGYQPLTTKGLNV